MTYNEFKRQLGKAGLSVKDFAELIQHHPNTITNYSLTGVPRQLAIIATLMGEMAEHGIDFHSTLARLNLKQRVPAIGLEKKKFGGSKEVL